MPISEKRNEAQRLFKRKNSRTITSLSSKLGEVQKESKSQIPKLFGILQGRYEERASPLGQPRNRALSEGTRIHLLQLRNQQQLVSEMQFQENDLPHLLCENTLRLDVKKSDRLMVISLIKGLQKELRQRKSARGNYLR